MQNPNNLEYLVSNIDILNKLKKITVKIILYKDLQNIITTSSLFIYVFLKIILYYIRWLILNLFHHFFNMCF